jgi:hypothetical protein
LILTMPESNVFSLISGCMLYPPILELSCPTIDELNKMLDAYVYPMMSQVT